MRISIAWTLASALLAAAAGGLEAASAQEHADGQIIPDASAAGQLANESALQARATTKTTRKSTSTLRPTSTRGARVALSTANVPRPLGLRFLYQNDDMNWTRAANPSTRQRAYIVLTSPSTYANAAGGCVALSEKLADSLSAAYDVGLKRQLAFLKYEGALADGTQFWVNGYRLTWDGKGGLTRAAVGSTASTLQALCTQSAPWSDNTFNDNSTAWHVETQSGALTFRG